MELAANIGERRGGGGYGRRLGRESTSRGRMVMIIREGDEVRNEGT